MLRVYFDYHNNSRAHMSLDGNAPVLREVEPFERGKVIAFPQVGGLHHRYTHAAAWPASNVYTGRKGCAETMRETQKHARLSMGYQ